MTSGATGPVVAILGDSVAAGLGVHGRSYAVLLAEHLQAREVVQLAKSTHTVVHARAHVPTLRELAPDVVVVAVGSSDGMVHPGRTVDVVLNRFAPKSWQGVEGLEPRAVYSRSRRKRLRQLVTNSVKVPAKHLGILVTGGYRRVELPQFEQEFDLLMSDLTELGALLVVVGIGNFGRVQFPHTEQSVRRYREVIERRARRTPRTIVVDPREVLRTWQDYGPDQCHPNDTGHARVADLLARRLEMAVVS